jgi:hypothetical protein
MDAPKTHQSSASSSTQDENVELARQNQQLNAEVKKLKAYIQTLYTVMAPANANVTDADQSSVSGGLHVPSD